MLGVDSIDWYLIHAVGLVYTLTSYTRLKPFYENYSPPYEIMLAVDFVLIYKTLRR